MDLNPEVRVLTRDQVQRRHTPTWSFSKNMDNRAKPLFTWQALQGEGFLPNARKQANLSAAIQKFFFCLRDERLDSQSARQRYSDEIEAIRDSMTEVVVVVTEPRWFADLLR